MTRVYRTKNYLHVFSTVFLAVSLFAIYGTWESLSTSASTWFGIAIATVLVLVGACYAAETFTARVVLTDISIRYTSVFHNESLKLVQIRYRREYEEYHDGPDGGTAVRYLELIPFDGEGRSLKLSKNDFDFDQAFWELIVDIPEFESLQQLPIHRH